MMQEKLTKWVELATLQKAIDTNVRNEVNGCPETIVMNNRKQFGRKKFTKFFEHNGTTHNKISLSFKDVNIR
jgi:hypothetical protein